MIKKIIFIFIIVIVISQLSYSQDMTTLQPKSKSQAYLKSYIWTLSPVIVGSGLIITHDDISDNHLIDNTTLITGITLVTGGLLFGPSFGHKYANREKPFKGVYTRLVGLSLTGLGLTLVANSDNWERPETSYLAMTGIGVIVIFYGIITDIASTGRSVDDYNKNHGFSLSLAHFTSRKTPGLKIAYNF